MEIKKNYLVLISILLMTFSITSFNFEDHSFEENTKEYIVFSIGLILALYYFFFKKE